MRNIQVSSPETDRKVLTVAAVTISAAVGYLLPALLQDPRMRILDALITLALGILVWGVFRLLEPSRFSQKWVVAKIAGIPIVWLLLVLALAIWFSHLRMADVERRNQMVPPIVM